MKKHMKGFTLVELLAVIVILAIVLIIAVPGVLSIINSAKQKGYESQLKMIKEATRNYVTAETSKIFWEDQSDGSKQVVVTLTELQANGYLDKKIIDPRDKSVITCADVTVKRDVNNKISYGVDATTCKPTDSKCFTFDKETGRIKDYDNTCPKNVKIPSQIDGTDVTTIGGMAFYKNQLTSAVIPDSVTTIEVDAFNMNKLKSVVIPNSVISIGDTAFAVNELTSVKLPTSLTVLKSGVFATNKLTSVTIPPNVTTIGERAFANNQLTNVVIPDSVTTIEYGAFNNNQLPEDRSFIYKRNADGTEDKTTIVSYGGAKRDNPIIPSGVTTIGYGAFYNNQLTSVEIPEGVTTIASWAFRNNQLTNVTIPNR